MIWRLYKVKLKLLLSGWSTTERNHLTWLGNFFRVYLKIPVYKSNSHLITKLRDEVMSGIGWIEEQLR